MLAQRNKDREVLEQFKYQGKLIDMESSLVKSQLEEVKGLSKYDPEIAILSFIADIILLHVSAPFGLLFVVAVWTIVSFACG